MWASTRIRLVAREEAARLAGRSRTSARLLGSASATRPGSCAPSPPLIGVVSQIRSVRAAVELRIELVENCSDQWGADRLDLLPGPADLVAIGAPGANNQ